ncbi:unnamed protein product [Nippostrongylus brasiliensis]|uniref:ABM domain-containing protein n=1 Tax=Nippostrongylus brasiliensis TaxID=27835 RepID=A0A158QZJ4_NIPBR|nr:unnamed protein product [Nippostrongylus brasiliensis]
MSDEHLFVAGNGLCGTYVTWSDIEEDMQHSLKTSAGFGPNKSFKDIGDGKGFASKILLIDRSWQTQHDGLPKRFVAKIRDLNSFSEQAHLEIGIITQLAMHKLNSNADEENRSGDNSMSSPTNLDYTLNLAGLLKRIVNDELERPSAAPSMSEPHLFVPGDGLCTTYVTWNDLEEDMQRSLKTSARFGPNKSFNDIGDGKGFASKILLINPDWQSQQEDLPEQFVAKTKDVRLQIVTMLAIEQLNSKNGDQDGTEGKGKSNTTELEHMLSTERFLKRGHNVEIAAYKLLAKIPEGKIKIPQIYSTKPFTDNNPVKGYILMEYCKDVEGAQMHRNIAPENLKPALKYLAVVTANSLNASQEERKEFHETMHKNALESDYLLQVVVSIDTNW